jgi:hypothetical protein
LKKEKEFLNWKLASGRIHRSPAGLTARARPAWPSRPVP